MNGREREFLTPLYSDFSYKKNGISGAELDGYVCSFSQPGAMRAGFMLYRDEAASAEENKSTAAKKLTIPVLAVGGQHSLGDFGAALQTVAANVRSVVIPDASHFLMSDNPQAVVQTLSGFFQP